MTVAIDFDEVALARAVERLSDAERDALPFGVVKLDAAGAVTFYSKTEAVQSGFKKRPAVGRDFFLEIAPCMNTPALKGRIDAARQAGKVDVEIGWVGDFDDPDAEMRIRAQSAADGGLWIFLQRDDASE